MIIKKTIVFLGLLFLAAFVEAQTISLGEQEFKGVNVNVTRTQLKGEEVLKVERNLEALPIDLENMLATVDEPTFLKLTDSKFQNGTIEVKVLSKLLKSAPEFARGFIGLAFRITEDNSKFESFYIRPTNGRAIDQVQRNHSTQYFSYPDYKFARLRNESPGMYESYADMGLNEWVTLKIEVNGTTAELFLDGKEEPVLIVNDLKHGPDLAGAVGLWVDIGTEGYFKDLKVELSEPANNLKNDKISSLNSPYESIDKYFTTSDGVKLHYRVAGKGPALVIFPGYGQDASKFDQLYEQLREYYTIYTLDYRWLGLSEAPLYGAHISRFAMDAKEMIDDAKIEEFYLFAHSMGNTVAWNYFSLFGQEKVKKYILGDEAPCLITDPGWTSREKEMFTGSPQSKDLWTAWRSPEIIGEQKAERSIQETMMAKLLVQHLSNDWRDIIPTIKVPTMIVMGGKSHFDSPLLWEWLQKNIVGSRLEVLPDAGHAFYESHPDEFTALVSEFFK